MTSPSNIKPMENVGTPFTASAGIPPYGWAYADEETNNEFNRWGQHPYLAAFMTTEGGEGQPKYGLTILWDEQQRHYIPAHGGVIMPDRVATAEKAADIALCWYEKQTGLARQAKHALTIEFTDADKTEHTGADDFSSLEASKVSHQTPSENGMSISIESTVQQSPQDRLKAVRQIGFSASSALDRGRNEVREGRADRALSAVASANAKWVQDTELTALLSRDDLSPYDKLVSITQRTAALGAEIEGPLLPPGWTVTESISGRNYRLQGGGANVSVTKDSSDRGSMNIKVHGYNTWSGYEGDTTGYVPLAAALQRAQETLIDPSKHLSPYGVAKVAEAKNKIDEIEKTREESLAVFRNETQEWQATADRYKNALLGERNILLDKHERAFSLVQVDRGGTRSQLQLPKASLNGVLFMNAVDAEKARAEMEKEMPESAPYKVWDFRDYALSKVNETTRIATLLVNEKWSIDRESKSLADAKELASLVIEKAGFKVAEWREGNAITPWEYTDVDVGGGTKMTVGASSGGVVSIDGHPFSPEKRQMNTMRGQVEESIYSRVAVLRRDLGAEDGRVAIKKQLSEQGFRMEFDAGTTPGEGPILLKSNKEIHGKGDLFLANKDFYVNHVLLMDDAYETYKQAYGESHPQKKEESNKDYVKRCAEQDFENSEYGGAIFQKLANSITAGDDVKYDYRRVASAIAAAELNDKREFQDDNEKDLFRTPESDVSAEGAVTKERKRDGYIVLTIDNTKNAAFVDVGRDEEIARIIDEAADKFEDVEATHGGNVLLLDTNGNRVGKAKRVNDVPTDEVDVGTVRLSIGIGGGAFDEDDTGVEIARILRGAATQVRDGNYSFPMRDSNGNTVGEFKFVEPKTLDADSPSPGNDCEPS